MSTTRRTFIKGLGASAVALYSHDLIADLIAQTPRGNVRESKFKGLADLVLGEAKMAGCSYADVRFTMTVGIPGANANFSAAATGRNADAFGGGGGGRGGRGGGGRGGF